jgi:acetoin utilization deacetylase AcuC-like enzyme
MMTTGLGYEEACLEHDNGSMLLDERARTWLDARHPECPERVERTHRLLRESGVASNLTTVPGRRATSEELRLVHSEAHLIRVRAACARDEVVWVGPEARASRSSWDPSLLAAGGLLSAVDLVLTGKLSNAYLLLRPPGHHASADRAMGFCLFNAVAVGARHAQLRGLGRVAIVDWDVHHGNGTQDIFYGDDSVLFVSLHQDGLYPAGSGTLTEVGTGDGEGFTVNIPLQAGTGDAGYALAFDAVVEPVVRRFGPDIILVSAGQDPAASDPLGRMSATTEGFRAMATRLVSLANEVCEGRILAFQEGGYSVEHMPYCTLAIIEALAGLPPTFDGDPLEIDVPTDMGDGQLGAVERAARVQRRWWGT